MSRLELPDGQWAELRDWLTHGEEKGVLRAWATATKNLEEAPEVDTALLRAYVAEWHVKGRDGHELSLDRLEDAPGSIVALIVAEALPRWQKRRADPNALGA
jgi:hypothetical protein